MRMFDKDGKINFVDEANVLVGYDLNQNCCERADWFISETEDKETTNNNGIKNGLEDYAFDPNYFVEVKDAVGVEDGGMVRFKMISANKKDLYLHLFNSHNGYYGHGFMLEIGGKVTRHGTL